MKSSLIIATESTYKKELLSRLGIPFEARAPRLDESALPDETPRQSARRLARQKADFIAKSAPNDFVLGADQVVFQGATRFSKAGTKRAAVAQLMHLQGSEHFLFTAISLRGPDGRYWDAECEYKMLMRPMSREALEAYVELDNPIDCAGSYKVEAAGIRLFSRMQGDDFTSIIGLPLTRVTDVLESAGFAF